MLPRRGILGSAGSLLTLALLKTSVRAASAFAAPPSFPIATACSRALPSTGSPEAAKGAGTRGRRPSGSVGWALAFACGIPALRTTSAVRAASGIASARMSSSAPEIAQFQCLSDNYGFLLHCPETGATAAIDTPDAGVYSKVLEEKGWKLTHILNTHHHWDHAGGNEELKKLTGCKVIGPKGDSSKIPTLDEAVDDGDTVTVGNQVAKVLNVGGHTMGHVAFHFDKAGVAFVGDSLFSMGCGRMFEGTYPQFYASLQKLSALPDETKIYCAHEYTAANAKFALSVEPGNAALQKRVQEVTDLRAAGKPTVPTVMSVEKETNPFLRWDSPELRKVLGLESADAVDVFAEVRKRKDKF